MPQVVNEEAQTDGNYEGDICQHGKARNQPAAVTRWPFLQQHAACNALQHVVDRRQN